MRRCAWLTAIGISYSAAVGIWFGLRLLVFDQIWWMLMVNSIAVYLFTPLPLLLALALWRRRMRVLLALGLPTLLFLLLFGMQFLPPRLRSSVPHAGRELTVMTFNVLYTNRDFDALIGAIRAAQPDIVGFQELTPKISQALVAALAADYPYHTLTSRAQTSGVGIISRFPIEQSAAFALPPRNLALHTVLRVDGAPLHVVVVHLQPSRLGVPLEQIAAAASTFYAFRLGEVAAIEREILGVREPLLLLCDCNMPDTSQGHELISAFLGDSFRDVGWGFGHTSHLWPLPFATQRLDYVWHSAGLTALAAQVGQPGGSDHFPVVARLVLHAPAP
jgi:vancomycin resistance protein VanJ